jgi:hypothetical protein
MKHEHQRSVLASCATAAQNLTDPPEQKRKVALEETTSASRRTTRSMTTDAARRAVFDTTELLESILVCLPPKNLFGVLRVSRRFRAVITASIPIQEKMFLRVRNKPWTAWKLEGELKDTHFVEELIPTPWYQFKSPVELNPFLELCHQDQSSAQRVHNGSECLKLALQKPVPLSTLDSKTPSILDTYASDPPFHEMETTYDYQLPGGHVTVESYLGNKDRRNWTIRDAISAALADDGWCHIELKHHERDDECATDEFGGVLDPEGVIQYYEKTLGSKRNVTQGIRAIEFNAHGIVVPTEAERAAVKAVKAAA